MDYLGGSNVIKERWKRGSKVKGEGSDVMMEVKIGVMGPQGRGHSQGMQGAFRRQEENRFSPRVIQRNAALLAPRR